MAETITRRLSAIVSVDVAGYSRLMALDEVGTVRRLTEYRELMARIVQSHGGRVVDNPGDNALLEFPSATDAVECAITIQEEIRRRNTGTDPPMELRIGVHVGEVMVEDGRIYGDGVNVAARLEALAPVGGVCLSKTVRDQVESKVNARFEDMGEHQLKNIRQPVPAFYVGNPTQLAKGLGVAPNNEVGTPDRRAVWIAVLPFDNIGNDPEQEYFADGITEDVITGLSAYRSLRVIARTSSFRYRNSELSIPEIAEELSVQYVLEGSVRKAGSRVRVTAQLIEAPDRHHIWADRYDTDLDDIFDAQDHITSSIVAAIDPAIRSDHISRPHPEDLRAWDLVQRGMHEGWKVKPESIESSIGHFRRAIELDPEYAEAHAGLSRAFGLKVWLLWSTDPEADLRQAESHAKRAIELDGRDALGHEVLSLTAYAQGRMETTVKEADRAIQLNPSLATSYMMGGAGRIHGGDPEAGIPMMTRAMELSPQDPFNTWFLGGRAIGHLLAGHYEAAITDARSAVATRYGYLMGRVILTVALVQLGRSDEAKRELATLLEIDPKFGTEHLARYTLTDEQREMFEKSLAAAGLPS